MMAQYRRIKGELPRDAILLFRLGDFYEMFFEDAQSGALLLHLAPTARNGVPICGVQFLAAVNPGGKAVGLALVDLTTGDFLVTERENEATLLTELERLRPAEILFPAE